MSPTLAKSDFNQDIGSENFAIEFMAEQSLPKSKRAWHILSQDKSQWSDFIRRKISPNFQSEQK